MNLEIVMERNRTMNRKTEKAIVWVGIVLSVAYVALFGIILAASYSPDFINTLMGNFHEFFVQVNGSELSSEQIAVIVQGFAMTFLIATIITVIMALIAVVSINKNRILAGILLIVAAFISILLAGFISAVLWAIAGIAMLVRSNQTNEMTM